MIKDIAVCIITYKRPIFLRQCITTLLIQKPDFDLYIIDNDKNLSAKRVIDFMQHDSHIKLNYVIEKNKGIPFARNKAVKIVKSKYKYLTFIDDDEGADKLWLLNLYKAIKEYDADIIAGPVFGSFKNNTPRIIKSGNFLRIKRKKYIDGQLIKSCGTGNIIIKNKIFKKYPKPFNEKFENTGGSDAYFFEQVSKEGYTIKWCANAIVYEKYAEDRLSLRWNLMRSYRIGNSKCFGLKLRRKYVKIIFKIFLSIFELALITFLIPLCLMIYLLGYKKLFIILIKTTMRTLGFCIGVLGHRYQDYK